MMNRSVAWPILLSLVACGDPSSPAIEENEALTETLRARAGDTTLWVDRYVERRGDRFDIRARTSRNLTEGTGFIFDDVYGAFEAKSARTFTVSYFESELGGLAGGVPLFVRTGFLPSSGRPDSLTARLVVRPRIESMSGSSYIQATQELTPVSVGGRTVFRLRGRFTRGAFETIQAQAGDYALTDVRRTGMDRFEIDLQLEHALAIFDGGAQVKLTVKNGSKTYEKTSELRLAVMSLELTAGDAYEVWPPRKCTEEIQACLSSLPAGTADLSSCGEAYDVNACPLNRGEVFDDVAFNAAMVRADSLLVQVATDAVALVGAARRDQLVESARMTIEGRFEQLIGGYYADPAARDAASAGAIDDVLDAVYARPLDYVEAITTNPARLGDVAADALLLEIAGMDFASTEFGRPLEVLAQAYRARHLAAFGELRSGQISAEPSGADFVYLTHWLDAYVEITVSPATGTASRVYFEID
jgi:hypothetical protein